MKGTLYVLPALLAPDNKDTLSLQAIELLKSLTVFAVENAKTSRRMIRSLGISTNFDQCSFYSIHHKNDLVELNTTIQELINELQAGNDVGVLSECGMAGIADPGSMLVAKAHKSNITVQPIVGSSSILLALSASGFNGQKFTFHGYLPIEGRHRKAELKALETEVNRSSTSQIFIETPYRNVQLYKAMQEALQPNTKLCIACNLTSNNEFIATKTMQEWGKTKFDINKKPAVFIIGK